jgi:hypothetical protein
MRTGFADGREARAVDALVDLVRSPTVTALGLAASSTLGPMKAADTVGVVLMHGGSDSERRSDQPASAPAAAGYRPAG